MRVIDEEGKNLGILDLKKALSLAKEKGLDLIQVTEKVTPPVCKLGDYGKYLYQLEKKERKKRKKQAGKMRQMRLGFGISTHDMEIKAQKVADFLKKGHKVRIEMVLKGREKSLEDFAKNKIEKFLEILNKKVPLKIERELKKERRGFCLILIKA